MFVCLRTCSLVDFVMLFEHNDVGGTCSKAKTLRCSISCGCAEMNSLLPLIWIIEPHIFRHGTEPTRHSLAYFARAIGLIVQGD